MYLIASPCRSLAILLLCLVIPATALAQSEPTQTAPTEAQLKQQIASTPEAPSPYLALAVLYLDQQRYEEAARLIQNALVLTRRLANQSPGGDPPVRVGGDIKEPMRITHVDPIYPADAIEAGVSGLVIIEAIIDTEGNVRQTQVLRSVPGLDQAAEDAVSQWKYTPTLLNGTAVEVIMTVTVNFSGRS